MNRLIFIILAIISLAAPAASAQSQIDKIIQALEKSNSMREQVYSTRRNPSTGKIFKESRIMSVSVNDARKLVKAFVEASPKSVSYNSVNNEIYNIEFVKGSEKRAYSIVRDGRAWVLFVEISNPANAPSKKRRMSLESDLQSITVTYLTI